MYIVDLKKENKTKPYLYTDIRKLQKDPDSPLNPGQNFYVHNLPKFPSFMRGKTYRYAEHEMDLYNLRCSCEYQSSKREIYQGRDIRLLCKHLYYKILKTSAAKELDPLTLELMKNAVLWSEKHLYRYRYMEQDIILGFKEGTSWVNVYSPNKFNPIECHRYSYNPITTRWSYNNQPEYGDLIPDLISRVIKYSLTFEHPYQKKEALKKHL